MSGVAALSVGQLGALGGARGELARPMAAVAVGGWPAWTCPWRRVGWRLAGAVDISDAEVPRIAHILDDVASYHEARGRDGGSTGSRPRHDGRGLPAHVGSARNQDPLEPWPVAGGDGVAAVVPGARWVVDRGRGGCAPRSWWLCPAIADTQALLRLLGGGAPRSRAWASS